MSKYIKLLLIIVLISAFSFSIATAQDSINFNIGFESPDEYADSVDGFGGLINDIYNTALAIAGVAAVGVVVYGAIYLTISGSSPDKRNEGKDIIISAIWGLVLLFGAYVILSTINPVLVRDVGSVSGDMAPSETQDLSLDEDSCIADVPSGEINECSDRVVPVGGVYPTCQEGYAPTCSQSGSDPVFGCRNINVYEDVQGTPSCSEGTLSCVGGRNVVCEGAGSPKTIRVPDCTGTFGGDYCTDSFSYKNVTIQPGGAYAQALYYPKNSSPSQASCEVYEYRETINSEVTRTGLGGLKLCLDNR